MTKIQFHRVEQGLSKRKLAEKAGVSDNVIRRIEKGEAYGNITLGSYNKIAKALGLPLFDIIDLDMLD